MKIWEVLQAHFFESRIKVFGVRGAFEVYVAEGVLNIVDTPLSSA